MSKSIAVLPRVASIHKADRWAKAGPEPSLDEVLADPLLHLVFRRDRLSPQQVRRAMGQARDRLNGGGACCCAA